MAILRLEGVRREIGDFVILDSVSARLARGERVGLVGANGAGKTTLLRSSPGREEPDAGRVHVARGTRRRPARPRRRTSTTPSGPGARRCAPSSAAAPPRSRRWRRELATLEGAGRRGGRVGRLRGAARALRGARRLSPGPARRVEALAGLGVPEDALGVARPASCPAASRPASRWPGCWSRTPTCCCSTSRPTTSTSPRSSGSRRRSRAASGRSWSRRTTAPSSTRRRAHLGAARSAPRASSAVRYSAYLLQREQRRRAHPQRGRGAAPTRSPARRSSCSAIAASAST